VSCSADDCGRGFCQTLCPDPCCIQTILQQCDVLNPTTCCKYGKSCIITQRYSKSILSTARGGAGYPLSQCGGHECYPPGSGSTVRLSPVRSISESEQWNSVIAYDCHGFTRTCLSANWSHTRNG